MIGSVSDAGRRGRRCPRRSSARRIVPAGRRHRAPTPRSARRRPRRRAPSRRRRRPCRPRARRRRRARRSCRGRGGRRAARGRRCPAPAMTSGSSKGCTKVAPGGLELPTPDHGLGEVGAVELHGGAEVAGAGDLHERRRRRHHDRGRRCRGGRRGGRRPGRGCRPRRPRPRRPARRRVSVEQPVAGAPLLERRGELEVLELHDDRAAEDLRERVATRSTACGRPRPRWRRPPPRRRRA